MESLLLCEQKQTQTVRSSSTFRNKKRNHEKTRVINHIIITVYFGKYLQIFDAISIFSEFAREILRWRQIFSGIFQNKQLL